MKTFALITLLSTSLVAAAPAPFVQTAGTEDVAIPTTNFDKRSNLLGASSNVMQVEAPAAAVDPQAAQDAADKKKNVIGSMARIKRLFSR